jgi:hypothetical protein
MEKGPEKDFQQEPVLQRGWKIARQRQRTDWKKMVPGLQKDLPDDLRGPGKDWQGVVPGRRRDLSQVLRVR